MLDHAYRFVFSNYSPFGTHVRERQRKNSRPAAKGTFMFLTQDFSPNVNGPGEVNLSQTFLALLSLSQHGKCRRPLEFSFSQRDATALRTEIFTAIIAGRAPAFVSCMAVSHVSAY